MASGSLSTKPRLSGLALSGRNRSTDHHAEFLRHIKESLSQ
jgi:hypothetical protein